VKVNLKLINTSVSHARQHVGNDELPAYRSIVRISAPRPAADRHLVEA
jgi:hypothetical protein